MEGSIGILIAIAVGILAVIFGIKNKKIKPREKRDYNKIREDEIEKLKNKPVDDIIDELPDDAADGVNRVKDESDTAYDDAVNRRRKSRFK